MILLPGRIVTGDKIPDTCCGRQKRSGGFREEKNILSEPGIEHRVSTSHYKDCSLLVAIKPLFGLFGKGMRVLGLKC